MTIGEQIGSIIEVSKTKEDGSIRSSLNITLIIEEKISVSILRLSTEVLSIKITGTGVFATTEPLVMALTNHWGSFIVITLAINIALIDRMLGLYGTK